MTHPGQLLGYARVSTVDQHLDRQLDAIGQVDRMFTDKASGASTNNRPGLRECIDYAREGDTLRVASMDRLARSLQDLHATLDELLGKGVSVVFLKEQQTYVPGKVDPASELMLNVMGAIAQFERSLIRERQAEGIALAKAQGRYAGRPPSLTDTQLQEARRRISLGVPKAQVARDLGISRCTLYRSLATESRNQ